MSSWMTDAAAVQSHNGAAFNHLSDPNAGTNMLDPSAFLVNPSTFDPSQFQNQQMQQRMQNGGLRNTSPAFNNPVYQTNSVVPSKRPRPREDSLGTSPRQTPGMLPNSRSQTPQQGQYAGFPANNQPPSHASQPNPTQYSHLQHNGSANASPSPIMPNQLRPGAVPQRVSTASPHPFPPGAPQFAAQASPSQSENGARVDTPHNPYMQNAGFAPGYNQPFTPQPGRTSAPPQSVMPNPQLQNMGQPQMQQSPMYQPQQPQQQRPNNLEQQKMMYQMRMQQQLQQNSLMAAQRMQGVPQNQNPLAKQMQASNGQYPQGMRPQQPISRPSNPESFMKHLTNFMQSRSLPLDMSPLVGDRPINLVVLYMAVMKFGGYRKVSQQNVWAQVAQTLQFNPMQTPTAPQQIKGHYERNLLMFEEAYNSQQQRQKALMMQQSTPVNMGGLHPQMSPTKQINPQAQMQQPQYLQQQQQQNNMAQHQALALQGQSTPVKQTPAMNSLQQPVVNGFATPQASQQLNQHQASARNNVSRSVDSTPAHNGSSLTTPSPATSGKPSKLSAQPTIDAPPQPGTDAVMDYEMKPIFEPSNHTAKSWGGVSFGEEYEGLFESLVVLKPDMPSVMDLGVIDIHALTMSLQSGIHAEVRLALDVLAILSVESRLQLDLKSCEDLVETIIDCAEVQVELLAENAAEVSDVMLINSYEDVVRSARIEREGLQDIPEFGTFEYDLDRSVERLICITTILRNLSFYETNHALLADELVIKFLCVVIKYLGTRNMLLRTQINTLDFMKDVVIFLSNLSQTIEIPGKEQAICLLHFLLAFAPCPPPNSAGNEKVIFSSYDPAVHRYLPPAVDSLAKLLARDEPNRTFYKSIFTSDVSSVPPFDLLTRAFGLAISPVPGHGRDEQRGYMKIVEARKPHLMQGMLAAEILSNLVPGYETNIAKSWLTSEDGFAGSLLRLVTKLSLEAPPPAPMRGAPASHRDRSGEDEAVVHITLSGITILRRLMEKSQHPDKPSLDVANDGMIKKELLLGALLLKQPAQPRPEVIKQLCLYASLDS